MDTATAAFAAGYAKGQAAIAIIEPLVTAEKMREIVIQNIIPIHAIALRSDEDHGASEAWSDYQAACTRSRRAARWNRR